MFYVYRLCNGLLRISLLPVRIKPRFAIGEALWWGLRWLCVGGDGSGRGRILQNLPMAISGIFSAAVFL